MNNQVYKCERCGKLYTSSDWEKHDKEIGYHLLKRDPSLCRDDKSVGLCDECAMELTEWMDREKTRTAPTPEKKEEALSYDELIFKALAKELIEHAMRMNGEES